MQIQDFKILFQLLNMQQVRSQLWVIAAAFTLDLLDDELRVTLHKQLSGLDRAALSPKMRASYSALLLVALNSGCTMYLNYSLSGVRSRAPTPSLCLREEPSKKRIQ
jgi:hypothetical protein